MFVFLVHIYPSRRKIMILRRDVLFYIKKTSLLFCDVGLRKVHRMIIDKLIHYYSPSVRKMSHKMFGVINFLAVSANGDLYETQ